MARPKSNILVPIFSDVAKTQTALATKYRREAKAITKLVEDNSELRVVLDMLRGLKGESRGKKYEFAVSEIAINASSVAEANGYRAPSAAITIGLTVGDKVEQIVLSVFGNGKLRLENGANDVMVDTTSIKRVTNTIEGWKLEMEEKHNFDAKKAAEDKQFAQTTSTHGPRYEHK
jgi:hypothetical protein